MEEIPELVLQLYDQRSNGARLKEADARLRAFKAQPNAWRQALFYLRSTQPPTVMWFCLSVIEDFIWRSWQSVPPADRVEVRLFLMTFLTAAPLPRLVSNKLVKVIIDIAKQEWPHGFPEFLPTIQQLTLEPASLSLGLLMIKTMNEEFTGRRDDVPAVRKEELQRLLTGQVPAIFALIQHVLDGIFEKSVLTPLATQTPMPSPVNNTSYQASPAGSLAGSPQLFAGAGMARARSLAGSRTSSLSRVAFGDGDGFVHARIDSATQATALLAIETLAQLLGWVALEDVATPGLLDCIFRFASLNDEGTVALGTAAMSCVNELLSRIRITRDVEDFLMQVYRHVTGILKELTDDHPRKAGTRLDQLDEDYRNKFIDFINLFLSQHVVRVETSLGPVALLELLELLFRFTFLLESTEAFQSCLRTWSIFLTYLTDRAEDRKRATATTADPHASELPELRYRQGLLAFLRELLKKMQFKFSGRDLNEINDVVEDAEGATEWDRYVEEGVSLVSATATLFPADVVEMILPVFMADAEVLFQAHATLHAQAAGSAGEESTRLFCALKDLRTLLRMLASMANVFVDSFEQSLASASALVGKVLDLADYIRVHSLHRRGAQFCKLTMVVLVVLNAYTLWMARYAASAAVHPERGELGDQLVRRIVDVVVAFVLSSNEGEDVALAVAAASVLRSVAVTIHPAGLTSLPSMEALAAAVVASATSGVDAALGVSQRAKHLLSPKAQSPQRRASSATSSPAGVLTIGSSTTPAPSAAGVADGTDAGAAAAAAGSWRRSAMLAIVSAWALPLPNVRDADQGWEQRTVGVAALLRPCVATLRQMAEHPDFVSGGYFARPDVKNMVVTSLECCAAAAEAVQEEGRRSKAVVHEALAEMHQTALLLLKVYVHDIEVMGPVMDFFQTLLDSLAVLLGPTFVADVISVFLTILGGEQLVRVLTDSNSGDMRGATVVTRFLRLLTTVARDQGKPFEAFVPDLVGLCTSQLGELVRVGDTAPVVAVRTPFYELVYHLLDAQWRYFFSVTSGPAAAISAVAGPEQAAARAAQFTALLQVVAGALQTTDLEVFQLNLAHLQRLNETRKLYQRDLFRTTMLSAFLNILFGVLVNKTHEISRDDVVVAIYDMAAVDFDGFYRAFVPKLIGTLELTAEQRAHLQDDLRPDKDRPTFATNAGRFVVDCGYYTRLNAPDAQAIRAAF